MIVYQIDPSDNKKVLTRIVPEGEQISLEIVTVHSVIFGYANVTSIVRDKMKKGSYTIWAVKKWFKNGMLPGKTLKRVCSAVYQVGNSPLIVKTCFEGEKIEMM